MKKCNKCDKPKNEKQFYQSKGNKCIACCTIDRHKTLHGLADPELIRSRLIEKYERKLKEFDEKRKIYEARICDLRA